MNTADCDVLILGAGPAGCAAAIAARQNGLRVILLRWRRTASRIPGETLHPAVEPLFKLMGVWETVLEQQFHRHRGIWREDELRHRTFESYGQDLGGPWLGFQVDRTRLDRILQARAGNVGSSVVDVDRFDSLLVENDSLVSGVVADGTTYRARFVLDATGRTAWLAERLGLDRETPSPSQRIRFGWTRGDQPDLDSQPLFRQQQDGWDWVSPLGDGRCAWVKLRRDSTFHGLQYAWRLFRECAGSGYFLLGDAACLMDPSAANGVLRALMSGMYAVHCISATECGAFSHAQAVAEYRRWIADVFDRTRALRSAISSNREGENVQVLPIVDQAPGGGRSLHEDQRSDLTSPGGRSPSARTSAAR